MTLKKILAYKGKTSQTGLATLDRFPNLSFEGDMETFEDIINLIQKGQILVVLPLWNSHVGEITKTEALETIFNNAAKIEELWPFRIRFECVSRKNNLKDIKTITIVFAAEAQCSIFLKKLRCKKFKSTIEAYNAFIKDETFDAVLCAPKQWDGKLFKRLNDDVANPFNFTTFVLLGNVDCKDWKGTEWKSLRKAGLPKEYYIFGVEMPIPLPVMTKEQHSFLEDLTKDSQSIDDIPRIIFISRKQTIACDMLIELPIETSLDISVMSLKGNGYFPNIVVKRELGKINKKYTEALMKFLDKEFPEILSYDFVQHIGTKTCLYACPELNIIVHGFDKDIVEAVVRIIINKYFELIDNGISCTTSQKRLFNRYKKSYYKKGSDFIVFKRLQCP